MVKSWFEILWVSFRLGLTSFGGPIAHLGYFYDEYVKRRKWLSEKAYADLVALCQFLPGPASSQVGIGIGITRGGLFGGFLAFIGFTLPSVLILVLFAYLMQSFDLQQQGWIHGLKLVAVAIVAHAILGMGRKLVPDKERAAIAGFAIILCLLWATAWTQVLVILCSALVGLFLFQSDRTEEEAVQSIPIKKSVAFAALFSFFALLLVLPVLRDLSSIEWLAVFDSFYRAGSLVFGGGHVVLPMLEREVVPTGWISKEDFLAGYGAAQAVPGPLFTFASYLGMVMGGGWGALTATVAIFLPAFLLVIGTLPFWGWLRQHKKIQRALMGVNAAVVGILVAAWFEPIWTSSILTPGDFALAAVLFGMLHYWNAPPWLVVLAGASGGMLLYLLL
jgi:chromate transporter